MRYASPSSYYRLPLILILFALVPVIAPCTSSAVPTDKASVNVTATYCRVWGLLKYFHPNVRSAQMDWDSVFFAHLTPSGEVQQGGIDSIIIAAGAPSAEWQAGEHDTTGVSQIRAIDWLSSTGGGGNLTPTQSKLLRGLVQIQVPSSSLYTEAANDGNLVFENEKPYKDSVGPGPSCRLLALAKYWNVINYFYPYLDDVPGALTFPAWNALLETYIPKFLAARDTASYQTTIVRLCNEIHDTHSETRSTFLRGFLGFRQIPVTVAYVEGHFVVERTFRNSRGLRPGDMLLRIGGRAVDSIRDTYWNYVPASNEAARMHNVCSYVPRRLTRDSAMVVYRRGDRIDSIMIEPLPTQEISMLATHDTSAHWKHISPAVGFVDMAQTTMQEVPKAMAALQDTKCIIFDLRNFTKSTVWTLAKYLGAGQSWASFTIPSLDLPGTFNRSTLVGVHPIAGAAAEPYHGKIIALVDENTLAQGEYTAMMVRSIPGSIILGSQTSGAAGTTSSFPLPGGIRTMFSALGVYYPDGKPTQHIGIVPDVETHRTIEGLRAGRDEILEAAIKLATKN